MRNITIIAFIIIILIAAALRLVALDKYPAGLNADEAAIGYNAYSLLQTGKDEYGSVWPLSFKSFGDYKPGLYFYFVMPSIAILGLNEWAVRIPSALFGIGTVILIYFLSKEIFKNNWIAICSSFLLAICPWAIHFSRGGWESNAATFFITLGIWLFIKGLNSKWFLFWSMVSFLASMYTYQSPRLVMPIMGCILFILYKRNIVSMIRIIRARDKWIHSILLTLLIIPLIFQFTSGGGSERFQGLSFFSDTGATSRVDELRGEHQDLNSLDAKLLHNKLTAYAPQFLSHYLDHFRGDFLFIRGDPLIRNKVPETGQFYLITALFLIVGLLSLVKRRVEHGKLLLVWILVAPLASAMTYQTPHALRSLNMVAPLIMVMALGLFGILGWLRKFGKWQGVFIALLVLILSFEFVHYLESYYVHYPKRYPLSWEYGFSEMVEKLQKYESQYDKVIITDRYDQPYILILFYEKYDPKKYQPQARLTERDKFNFGTIRNFDKYEFRSIKPEEVSSSSGTLFIGTDSEIPKNAKILDKVNFPNNRTAFEFAEGGS